LADIGWRNSRFFLFNMNQLLIEIKLKNQLISADYRAIIDLCERAFEEDCDQLMATFIDPVHVLAKLDGKLVSHALWITRWLQIGTQAPLRTAYVEAVATDLEYHGQGFATAVMERLHAEIQDYDIGGLSPAETTLYSRLGWEYWQGPLHGRRGGESILFPEEAAMVLRLPNTPEIDIQAPASIEWREGDVW
jgi:aminoglycoside 2'-N-acetyltransferase I